MDVEAGSSDLHLEGFEEQYVVVLMYVEIKGESYRLQQCNHNVHGRVQHGSCVCQVMSLYCTNISIITVCSAPFVIFVSCLHRV